MISLFFDSALFRSAGSTSQPKQQKSVLWRLLRRCPNPLAERSIPQPATSRRGPNYPPSEHVERPHLRHPAEARKEYPPLFTNSPDHPFHSGNSFPADRLCLVCGVHCSASCSVCDQDFCSTHLYACVECDDQYCRRCLDDHRADGHWTDSDTAAELNRGWTSMSSSGSFRIGSMNLSAQKIGRNALPLSKPRVSLTPAQSQVLGHTQRSGTAKPDTLNTFTSAAGQTHRSVTSQRDTLTAVPSLLAFLVHAIRQGLSSSADRTIVKSLSQSEVFLGVSP